MKLIKKSEKDNLLKALSEVSGYSINELMKKKNRTMAPWKKVGIYIARQEGFTFGDAAGVFDQHITTSWVAMKHVEDHFDELQPIIKEIQDLKRQYDIIGDTHQ
tara:strand:- start:886 stop:1197 length:312 start_codon:yes stop_codon:yes gene_type:complete